MAVYPPPSFYSNIFDSNAFAHGNDNAGLTEDEANLLYYKYPVGQAFETLQQTDHTGLATFSAGIDLQTGTLTFPDNTVQSTAYTGGSGASSLSATLLVGNSAGATDINMNNNDITNCATLNTITMNRGSSTTPSTSNIGIGNTNMTSTASNAGANIAVGQGCLNGLTGASQQNIAFGVSTLQSTTGSYNLGIGSVAFSNLSSGSHNVAIGYQANQQLSTGSYTVSIGDIAGSDGSAGGNSAVNSVAIGRNAKFTGSSQIVLGTANETVYMKGNADIDGTLLVGNALTLNGATDLDRIFNTVYCQFMDKGSLGTFVAQIYGSSGALIFDNDVNSGSYSFAVNNSAGAQKTPFAFNALGATISTDNPATPNASLTVSDLTTGNAFVVVPNVGNSYNPSADINNIMLLGTGTQNTETLQLTTWSATNNYVKVRPTSVGMGAGGTSNTATSSVECNGSTVRIVPSLTFPDNTVQTTAYTGATTGINQVWSWNAFNITSTVSGNGIKTASIVLPYSSSQTFSASCRIEFNYAVFCNIGTVISPQPGLLSSFTGQSGGTNVNANTVSQVDLVYNPTTQTISPFICQSTYSKIFTNSSTTYWRGLNGYNYVPIKLDPIAPLTLNSPSAGFMTILLDVGVPGINYSSNPNYQGNLCSFATSIRITASQATTTDVSSIGTYNSGVAYFL